MNHTELPVDASIAPIIELRDIRAVSIIAEERSITRAAVRLNIAQPALSRRIRAIEARLGVRLFQRTPTGVEPTTAGRVLLEQGGELIAASHRLLDAVRSSESPTAFLRVGTTTFGASVSKIRRAVARFQAEHPDVEMQPSTLGAVRQAAAVIAGELDIGFGSEPLSHDRIGCQLLLTEHIGGVLLADDHPLAARERISMADLEGLDAIMPSPQASPVTYQRMYEALARMGRRRPARVMVESPVEGLSLVAAGLAFGFGYDSFRKTPLDMLRLVPVEGLSIDLPIYVYSPRWSERPEIAAFVELLLADAA
ncbi:MAG: LysR family transcriptional regulator [Gemmatimonadaceae bacterium]|jgi:DNA-binding transcriptional LysR family regulator|nr:LysR family transcriptional regulator [Gemmatimonadaceae bacterium]